MWTWKFVLDFINYIAVPCLLVGEVIHLEFNFLHLVRFCKIDIQNTQEGNLQPREES